MRPTQENGTTMKTITILTVGDLESLPNQSIVFDSEHRVWEKGMQYGGVPAWFGISTSEAFQASVVKLPAQVIYYPS